ncbi:MAG TPA: hypothetical protein VGF19_11710, partial [Candidatus Acidoferrum sp.]
MPEIALLLVAALGETAGLLAANEASTTAKTQARRAAPTFYRDVLPVLQAHCQVCHRTAGIAPMAFERYEETRKYAEQIRVATQTRVMPPWFADRKVGKFSDDPSLSEAEIALFADWVQSGAPAGDPNSGSLARSWADRWTIPAPDLELKMPEAVKIPADGEVEYTYEVVPTHFSEGRWVQAS